MRIKLLTVFLIAALPTMVVYGQNKAKATKVVSSFETESAGYIEQNKQYLIGFNELEMIKNFKAKGKSDLAISELITGQKIKYIKDKQGLKSHISAPVVNKALSACDNLGFSNLDFTNWYGGLGAVSGLAWGQCPDPIDSTQYTTGFALGANNLTSNADICNGNLATSERQVLLTCATCHDTLARDPNNGDYLIPFLAPGGGNASVRLGNAATGGETERLTYKINVTPSNSQLSYRYAVVYENPSGHASNEQPFFMVNIKDSTGAQIGGTCGAFCFFADPADPNFVLLPAGNQFNCDQFNDLLFRPWTSVGVDLSPYVGQTLYLEFTTGDCALSGHWGYAYVDASCGIQTATVSVCPNDSTGILIAPEGYSSYQWQTSAGINISGAIDDTLIVQNPQLGQSWIVQLESAAGAGCFTSLNVLIANYTTLPVQTSVLNLLCNGVTLGNATAIVDSSVLHGPFSYQWYNSNNVAIPGANSPVYNTSVAGTFWVKVVNSGGCGNLLPDTAVVESIPDFTLNPSPTSLNLCLQQSAAINLNPSLSPNTTININWEEFQTNNLNSINSASVTYTSNAVGPDTLVYTVISNFGCEKSDTIKINVSGSYIADGTGTGADTLCPGESTQLGIKFAPGSPELCALTNEICKLPINEIQIGNGTGTNNSAQFAGVNAAYPSPFGNLRLNAKQQYFYRAEELQAAGMKGGLISSIAFFVKNLSSVTNFNDYTVRMRCTNTSVATVDFDTAALEVYQPKPFQVISGWNNIDFDKSYAWDGVSNLVVEICMDNNTGGTQSNCGVEHTVTPFASAAFVTSINSPVCSIISGASTSSKRPNIKFSICGVPADTSRYTYQWNPSNGLSNANVSHPIASPNTSVYYVVTISDTVNGCSDTAGVYVSVPDKNVSFTVDNSSGGAPLTVAFTNTSSPNLISYFWNYGDGSFELDSVFKSHTHTFQTSGEYTVTLIGTNSNGCTDTATVKINALTSKLEIPNIFTPNNDGKNDVFILDAPGIASFSGVIFNRWGKKVFEWTDPNKGWEGKGEKDGVYYYVIKAKGVDGQEYENTGNITLVR